MNRDARGVGLKDEVGATDKLDVVELVVAGDSEGWEEEGFAVLGGESLGGEGGATQCGLDAGAGAGVTDGAIDGVAAGGEGDTDGTGDIAGDGDRFGKGTKLGPDDAVFERGEGLGGRGDEGEERQEEEEKPVDE